MTHPGTLAKSAACCLLLLAPNLAESAESRLPARTLLEGAVMIPLDLSSGRPTVEVHIGGQGPYTMILDTGAAVTFIDASVVEELGLARGESTEISSPMRGGTPLTAYRVTLPEVSLADARFEAVPALTWEDGLLLPGIRGVLAVTLFRALTATFDFPASSLTLTNERLVGAALGASVSFASQDMQIVEADVNVGGHQLRGHIDTGSPGGISIPGALARQLEFTEPPVVVGHGRTIDSTFEIRSADYLGTVTLAGLEFVNPTLTIIDALPTANVGTGALLHTRLHLDGPAQRLWIEEVKEAILAATPAPGQPIVATRQAAPGASAPFGIMAQPAPDAISVSQVVPDSRAEQSGLLAGDRITAIDGTPVSEIAPAEMGARLGRAGALLTVRRENDTLTITVR